MTITRDKAKELLPIIKAFAEGKSIQDKIEGLTDWVDTDEINLEYEGQIIKHRIKPEPKYRPFKSQEECWNEMSKHFPFGWIKNKKSDYYTIVDSVYNIEEESNVLIEISPRIGFSGEQAYKQFLFRDGTPFGIKEE